MYRNRDWFRKALAGVLAYFLCLPLYGQQQEKQLTTRQDSPAYRQAGVSELEKENLGRVAASVPQIVEVLRNDTGLLVELKRWVAKEASDNGQVVQDADLTDHAIFDRLGRDVQFRSVATKLLQRYGYLMPSVNPDSEYGKQQELILKERARRLVQIEAQEDTASLGTERSERGMERTGGCDPRQDRDCAGRPAQGQRRKSQAPAEGQEPQTNPPRLREQVPQQDTTRTIQTAGVPSESDLADGLSGKQPGVETTFSPLRRTPASGSEILPPGALDGALATGDLSSAYSRYWEGNAGVPSSVPERDHERRSRSREEGRPLLEEEFAPVSMVRRPNPYADIPSLYDMYVQAALRQRPLERFGQEVFQNGTREANAIPMDLPVGPDYVVGPGDGLAIDLWGAVSQRLFRTVGREGRLSLPETGPLLVSGRTLGEVQEAVQQALRTQFRDVYADVSLSRLRTVRVYVVGDVAEPGAYDISSLSTPLNALFEAGGVTPRGSLRELKHYRGKQLVQEVDAYDLLLHGVRSDLKRLENGDTLMVPPIGPQVTVDGMVRRPAIYELNGEKSLAEVLELAGGILPAAALRHIEVQRLEAHQKRTMLSLNLSPSDNAEEISKQLSSFEIRSGDEVHIFPIAPYNEDAIYLQGHVLRPGRYSYKQGMKLTDLIASYSDLLPEPAPHYAEIVRLNPPDFHPSVESFDLSAALANPVAAPKLDPLDTVRVFSRYDFEPAPAVWVGGEVQAPGRYRTPGQAHLRDAIYLAGGTTQDAAFDSAQLFRTQPDGTMKILSVNLRDALAGNPVDNILLQPRDRILVHRNLAKVEPPTVYVKGEVTKSGRYPLTANMRVEDLIRVAGGLKRSAYADSADLTHYLPSDQQAGTTGRQEVNIAAAMSGDPMHDVALRDGDVLTIRQIPGWNDIGASITVRGEVQHPGTYGIAAGERLSSVLGRAGGFGSEAYPYGAVLVRREVREIQEKSYAELIRRVQEQQKALKLLPETDGDQKAAKQAAILQAQTTLDQLQTTPPVGRLVIHISSDMKSWRGKPEDVAVRDGDELVIPKKANYVAVAGQVYNPTAISHLPGKSAKWYLGQAGGLTQIANKKGVFVIRANGSVISAKNSGGWWSGDPLNAVLRPGDTIVVPEKALGAPNRSWAAILTAVQVASSVALTVRLR